MGFLLPSNDAAMISAGAGMAISALMSLFTTIRANNVSANGFYAELKTLKDNDGCDPYPEPVIISKFADDADALTLEPSTVTTAEPSFNGVLVTTTQNPLVTLTLGIIPFSNDAVILDDLLREVALDSAIEINMNIAFIRPNPDAMKPYVGLFMDKTETCLMSFSGGKMLEAPIAPSISQYRLNAKRYSFLFSGFGYEFTDVLPTSATMAGTWSL